MLFLAPTTSCRKPSPQLPSNKTAETEEQLPTLTDVNRLIAAREDSLLLQRVERMDSLFQKSQSGFWYRINKRSDGQIIVDKIQVKLAYQVFSLDDEAMTGLKQELIEVGKKQVPKGLEEGLKLMRKGENATLVLPWYLAYGVKGSAEVPSYTSVILRVHVEKD